MTPLEDDLLAALRAAQPDPGYQPSAASPAAAAMLARIVLARPGVTGPDAAERDFPPVRRHTRKENLMMKLQLARRPLDANPPARRRRAPIIIIATAAAGLTAAAVTLLSGGNPQGASPAAVQLLAKISAAAAAQPTQQVRDSQFWYIKTWSAYQACDGNTGKCVMEKPQEVQLWQSVSNECVTGLERAGGQDTPLVFSSNYLHCPYQGGVNDPTYRFLQSLPTNPQDLLSLIEQRMQGQQPRPQEAFTTIGDILHQAIVPPAVSAALYRAAALIPGVTVVPDATDAVGRHGVAVAMTAQGTQSEWIFSKRTFQYLGERDISTADGSTTGESAVLQRAFVDHAGQLPS